MVGDFAVLSALRILERNLELKMHQVAESEERGGDEERGPSVDSAVVLCHVPPS